MDHRLKMTWVLELLKLQGLLLLIYLLLHLCMHVLDLLHAIVAEGWCTLELIQSKGDLVDKTEKALLLLGC